jgi:acyl-CoA synthetase (AMP-forming)/AMP-acid ligase II
MRNNVGLFLAKRADLEPDREGFVDVDNRRRFSFGEWDARSNRTAAALTAQGVRKGEGPAVSFGILGDVGAVAPKHVFEIGDDRARTRGMRPDRPDP